LPTKKTFFENNFQFFKFTRIAFGNDLVGIAFVFGYFLVKETAKFFSNIFHTKKIMRTFAAK